MPHRAIILCKQLEGRGIDLRWKLFIPLACILTVAGLLGSYFWNASASQRQLAALNKQTEARVEIRGDQIIITVDKGHDLADVLSRIDRVKVERLNKVLRLQRAGVQELEPALARQIDLIAAQSVATREYYHASEDLKELAARWGYEADMLIWEGWIVAEVGNNECSYITLLPLKEVDSL